jgi:hypothetical protein
MRGGEMERSRRFSSFLFSSFSLFLVSTTPLHSLAFTFRLFHDLTTSGKVGRRKSCGMLSLRSRKGEGYYALCAGCGKLKREEERRQRWL